MSKCPLFEIEQGPHFITFYTNLLNEMKDCAGDLYNLFVKKHPHLKRIQQKDFNHEPGDPNVYHPFGAPGEFRKYYRHFHIRYRIQPTANDILEARQLAREAGFELAKDMKITNLEDNNPRGLKYPSYEDSDDDVYLKSLEEIRYGEFYDNKDTDA